MNRLVFGSILFPYISSLERGEKKLLDWLLKKNWQIYTIIVL